MTVQYKPIRIESPFFRRFLYHLARRAHDASWEMKGIEEIQGNLHLTVAVKGAQRLGTFIIGPGGYQPVLLADFPKSGPGPHVYGLAAMHAMGDFARAVEEAIEEAIQ